MSDVIADSSPLINLAKIERFELLQALFGQVIIPPGVWDELVVRGVKVRLIQERSRRGVGLRFDVLLIQLCCNFCQLL